MIHLTRLNGQGFVLNPDLILKAETTPDTIVTLVDGTRYVVEEPLDVLAERVLRYRASVVAVARELTSAGQGVGPVDADTADVGAPASHQPPAPKVAVLRPRRG
ncbi:MAG TPA: flagellar FlbD family protein [Actinomycetales bacterium]|nr:flagellar FlbD family protein [Actinomycetales bacterium]